MKKMMSVSLVLILVFSFTVVITNAQDTQLRFNQNGEFKIMAFADAQDDENLEETTTAFMKEALAKYKPDLVVFLGDNTIADGYDNQRAAIKALTAPVNEAGIPYTLVFGNHDQENGVDKEELLQIYQEDANCLAVDAAPEIYGCGNHNLPIYSSDGEKILFNLWLIDSGSKNTDEGASGYDYVHEDQIQWYKDTAEALKAQNGGVTVPAINFQHIIVPEIYDELYTELPFALGEATRNIGDKSFALIPNLTKLNGYCSEPPCPPSVYDGQFDAWLEVGDIMASFHGHDHVNAFKVDVKGIDVVNVPTVGCNVYHDDLTRGAGLITLKENDLSTYEYEHIRFVDIATREGSQIPTAEGGRAISYYKFVAFVGDFFTAILKFFALFNF